MQGLTDRLDQCCAETPRQEPIQEQLKKHHKMLLEKAADLEAAIKVLEAQPGLLETLNLLRRVGV